MCQENKSGPRLTIGTQRTPNSVENLTTKELVGLIDIATDALKKIAEDHHEWRGPVRESVKPGMARVGMPHNAELCRTCIANKARQKIALKIEEVPF